MSDRIKIPVGKFAISDEELKRKREELKRRLLNGEKIPISPTGNAIPTIPMSNDAFTPRNIVYFPNNLDLEKMEYTGNLYGAYDTYNNTYTIISTYDEKGIESEFYIGKILAEKPTMLFYGSEMDKLIEIENHLIRLKEDMRELKSAVDNLRYNSLGITIPSGISLMPPYFWQVAFERLLGFERYGYGYGYENEKSNNKIIGFYENNMLWFVNSHRFYYYPATIRTL